MNYHDPVSINDGGPPILDDIKIAHALCNGNLSGMPSVDVYAGRDEFTESQRAAILTILALPRDSMAHVQVPQP